MSNQQHTPGPWRVRKEKRTTYICDENGNVISSIKPVAKFGILGDDEANARLIAATPELLAMLEATRGQWIHSIHAAACLAVIAKATA